MAVMNNTLQTKNITFSVGIPNVIMQLLDGHVIRRMLTLEFIDDYKKLDNASQKTVIQKVAQVALSTIFIALAVAFITVEVIWTIPLCLLATMGLSFNFLTSPEYVADHLVVAKASVQKEKHRKNNLVDQVAQPTRRVTRSATLRRAGLG